MIKIAVCDDEKIVRTKLVMIIKEYFSEADRPVWVADYKTGAGLLKSNIRFDIIFLDVEMPDLNGIETAVKLREWDVNSKIIYVTNYSNYKGKAYKVHAFDYISKPIRENIIFDALAEAVRYLDHATEKQRFAFNTEEGIVTLELDDIYYIEYLSRRAIINTSKGKYEALYSLKELLAKLHKFNFSSPHKSYIVNLLHVKYVKGFYVYMENGENIPLAQKRAVGFKTEFNDFLQSTFDRI